MVAALKRFGAQTFSSFSIRNYRLYAIGQFISQCGTWMQTVVFGWLVIELSGSGTQLGTVVALQFLPILILGPWGGVLVDRFNKRRILYLTHAIFGLLAALMAALVYAEKVELWMLYGFALALGLIRVLDNPARQTFVTEVVSGDQLKNAVSLNATANNLARAVGPAVGGILIASLGIAACFFFNALTYVVAIGMLLLMRRKELMETEGSGKQPGQLAEGFRYVMATPLIRKILIMMAIIGTFSYEFQVSLPLLANFLDGSAAAYATLLGALGMGSVVGGLYSASRKEVAAHHLVLFALLFGISMFLTSLLPSLSLATLGMLLVGFFSINFTALATTMLQLESAPQMRGRVMSLWSVAFIGSTTIGGPIIGFIGEFAGAPWGLGFGGLVALATAAIAATILMKKDRLAVIPEIVELRSEQATIGTHKL